MLPRTSRIVSWLVLAAAALPRIAPAQEAELAVREGEIRVDGVVDSVNSQARSLVIRVRSFTLPDGRSSSLAAPKPKTVTVTDQTAIHRRGDPNATLAVGDLRPGWEASAVGPDLGSGKDLPARELAVAEPRKSAAATSAELVRTLAVKAKYLTISPDGKWLAVIPAEPNSNALTGMLIYDLAEWRELRQYEVGVSRINQVAFSPRGDLLAATVGFASAAASFGLKLWDTATWTQKPLDLQGHSGASYWGASFSADGSRVASGNWSGKVIVWDVAKGTLLLAADDMRPPAPSIGRLSPDGLHLITEGLGDKGNQVTIWDVTTKTKNRTLDGDVACYLPDGKRLIVSSEESRAVTLWDTAGWTQLHAVKGKGAHACLLAPNGEVVATVAESKGTVTTTLWELTTPWKKLCTVPGQAWAFSADGRTIAVLGDSDTILHDVRSGKRVASLAGSSPVFLPDNRTVVTISADQERRVSVWRLPGAER